MTSFPIPILIRWIQQRDTDFPSKYSNVSVYIPVFITLILSIVTPMILFNYLNSKKSVDVFHSLPIKRSDLFLTNYVSTLLIIFIPFTLAYFSGYALNNILFQTAIEWYHFEIYFQLLAIFFATTTPVMFVLMNTGTLSDALIYTVIIFIAPFLAFGALELFASTFIRGYTSMRMDSLAFLSPPISVFFGLKRSFNHYDMALYASYWLILGLILLSISLVIHDGRKSEKSETPFINNWFFPLIIYLFTGIVLIFLIPLFSMGTRTLSFGSVVMPLLISLLLFTLLNIIKNRSLKNMTLILKNYTIYAVILMIFCITVYKSNGFGFTYYIPKIDKIESVSITSQREYDRYSDSYSLNNAGNYLFQNELKVTHENPELLEITNVFHYSIVNQLKENGSLISTDLNKTHEYTPIYIEYKLKSGSKIKRLFYVKDELLKPLYPAVNNPDTIKDTNLYFNEDVPINQTLIFNNKLTEGYRFMGSRDQLIALYKEDLLNTTPEPNGESLNYVLAYNTKNSSFMGNNLINIDSRHPKTTQYIRENIKPIENMTSNVVVYSDDVLNTIYGKGFSGPLDIERSERFDSRSEEVLDLEKHIQPSDRISSLFFNDKPHRVYGVNIVISDLDVYFEYLLSVQTES